MSANEQPMQEAERVSEDDRAGRPVMQASDGGDDDVPLFLRGISDGYKGDAQDEKDGVGE